MKKKIYLLLVSSIFISCSKNSNDEDDSSSINNIAYCNITVNGETIHHEFNEGMSFSYGTNQCTTNFLQRIQNVEQFENSNYFIDLAFVHNENLVNFQGYTITSSAIKNKGFSIVNPQCYNNLDFIAEYKDKSTNTILNFNTSSNNINTIQSINLYNEDSLQKIYAVVGNFSVTYKKSNGTLIPMIGEYKTFIYVLK